MSGIVVDHKDSKVRYAISERNFNEKVHTKVRDLKPGETVIGFTPKPIGDLVEGQPEDEGYGTWLVKDLTEEIATRNTDRDEEDLITPDSGLKADLVAALELDDETQTED